MVPSPLEYPGDLEGHEAQRSQKDLGVPFLTLLVALQKGRGKVSKASLKSNWSSAQKPTDITHKSSMKMVGVTRGCGTVITFFFSMAKLKSLTKKKKKSEAVWS